MAGVKMKAELDEDTEAQTDEEEMEAMLYSQIHFEYDDNVDKGPNEMDHAPSSSTAGPQHTFSVTSLDANQQPEAFSEKFRAYSVSGHLSDTRGLSLTKRPMSLLNTEEWDDDKLTQGNQHACDNVPGSLPVLKKIQQTQKDIQRKQTQSKEIIVCDELGDASKKSKPKSEFDLEEELGMHGSRASHKRQSKSANRIDTMRVKSRSKPTKRSESVSKPLALDFIRLGGQKPKSKSSRDYKKPLNQLLTSHSNSKNVKQAVVIDSDSSTSSDSSSTSSSSGAGTNKSKSHSESSDSESDLEVLDNTDISRPSGILNLDLDWNVNSVDRQTIQLVERLQGMRKENKSLVFKIKKN